MNKRFLISCFVFMFVSCSSMNHLPLISTQRKTRAESTYIFLPSGAIVESFQVVENQIEYSVGISNGRIVYIATDDNNFTINGLKINDRLPQSYLKREWGFRPGWGYYIEIESGWYACLDFSKHPDEESRIQFFFQFDFQSIVR